MVRLIVAFWLLQAKSCVKDFIAAPIVTISHYYHNTNTATIERLYKIAMIMTNNTRLKYFNEIKITNTILILFEKRHILVKQGHLKFDHQNKLSEWICWFKP